MTKLSKWVPLVFIFSIMACVTETEDDHALSELNCDQKTEVTVIPNMLGDLSVDYENPCDVSGDLQ